MAYEHMGCRMRDKITGFSGIVTGHCDYLTGCNKTLLQPSIKADGDMVEAEWIDDQCLELVGDERVVLDNGPTPGFGKAAPRR